MREQIKEYKIKEGEIYFKSYRTVLTFFGFIKTERYQITLDEKIEYLLDLGSALEDWNPEENLAKFLVGLDKSLPEKFEEIMIDKLKEMRKKRLDSIKNNEEDIKNKLNKITKRKEQSLRVKVNRKVYKGVTP